MSTLNNEYNDDKKRNSQIKTDAYHAQPNFVHYTFNYF